MLFPFLEETIVHGAVLDKENNLGWRKLIEYFVVGATARSTSEILDINIYENCKESIEFAEEVELDESYFRGSRKGKGRRERGAAWKTPVFGILYSN